MNLSNERYLKYSSYLREKYGEKVYKIPINLPVTCPNRDGCVGEGGCIFCGEVGAGFESLQNTMKVREQLEKNIKYIGSKYNAKRFIAYFQNFTNTYMPLKEFEENIIEAAQHKSIVELCISTRPDCINDKYLYALDKVKRNYNINISIEMGLQTVNYKTLKRINRGHTLAEFIDAMIMIKRYGFESCAHLILNLPWDDIEDTIESAKILSAMKVDQVKLHSLYILKDTELGGLYKEGKIKLISLEEYVERVVCFLEYLDPSIAIQRLVGRAPKEDTLFCNWETSWWKIQDMIDEKMDIDNIYQGNKYNYLRGKALKNFI